MRRLNNNITMLKILFTLAMTLGLIRSFNFCANKDLEISRIKEIVNTHKKK